MLKTVAVLGGGPGGLYFAYLCKRAFPRVTVHVFEQNPSDATFGFGVVFSERALDFLRQDDAETHALIGTATESWRDLHVVHRGEPVRIDGIAFAAVGRLELLALLQRRAREVGVELHHDTTLDSLDALSGANVIVGADGVNSLVRRTHARALGAHLDHADNRFAWYGTTRPFETLTQTFLSAGFGGVTAHHYRYQPQMSTFIVEMSAATWRRGGFAGLEEDASRRRCEQLFAHELQGHSLISNRSIWRRFPRVRNTRWWHGNAVLLGDALHTAHFSIGSGTRLAMEDAIALVRSLETHCPDLAQAFTAYEAARRPIVEKLVGAAARSLAWYERMDEHMQLTPYDFAFSYINRSGRVSEETLARTSPEFLAAWRARRSVAPAVPLAHGDGA